MGNIHTKPYRRIYKSPPRRLLCSQGFTLIELLVVIIVIALLAGIAIPSYKYFIRRAEKATCMSQMRVIHTALDSYLLDKQHWPQIPEDIFFSNDENAYWEWWILTLEPYGPNEYTWLCPSDKIHRESKDEYSGSYMPAKFDAHHFTPYKWASQPWLMERGKLHNGGAHIMFPDGSILSSEEVF